MPVMNIHVRHHASRRPDPALTRYVHARISAALDRFESEVVRVRVMVGSNSRAEQWCRVQADLTPNLRVLAFGREESALDAVNRAVHKLAVVVTRSRGHRGNFSRRGLRQLWASG